VSHVYLRTLKKRTSPNTFQNAASLQSNLLLKGSQSQYGNTVPIAQTNVHNLQLSENRGTKRAENSENLSETAFLT
jgi:hypothetical protein